MQELDEILKGEAAKPEEKAQKTALEAKAEEEKKQEDLEVQKKKEQLENLNKAIHEANEQLKKSREAKKTETEEEIPKIDFNDPSSKAWDRHIKENVTPMQEELAKEKEEIRTFALREFLSDKPSLSNDPEKIKELMATYEKLKTASERTKEGVLIDLNKAFGAVFHDELISQARESRVRKAQGDALFSDPAVSRGSTAYFKEHEANPADSLSDDDKQILAKWGMTPDEWGKTKVEMDKKEQQNS